MPYPHKLSDDQILDEAARMVDEDGLPCLSTRHLAERLGARAPSLYRYFPDKESLVQALSRRFQTELSAELAPHQTATDLGRAYWAYALRHPHRYEAVVRHVSTARTASAEEQAQAAEPLLNLATCLNPDNPLPIARALWSYLHGAVDLCLHTPASADLDPERAFLFGLQALVSGLAIETASHSQHQSPVKELTPHDV
jgi:AcrR family transcriptional regulator